MSEEERLVELEASVEDVAVSPTFASPAGDKALEFLDKEFSKIEEWAKLKLKDSRYKSLVLTQLEMAYATLRYFVKKALD